MIIISLGYPISSISVQAYTVQFIMEMVFPAITYLNRQSNIHVHCLKKQDT